VTGPGNGDIFRRMPTSPYDPVPDFGAMYDAMPAYALRGDAAFYVDEAVRVGGPVLELGCGTGRILLPVARAGVAIAGLDASPAMLARCREKLAAEPDAVRARVSLHQGDVRDFSLGTTFGLVTAPFRIVQHLTTIDDQLRCLACVARHLAPRGRFVFDVFNPSFAALLADRTEEHEDATTTLADGRAMRRTFRIPRARLIDQVNETELIYYVDGARHVQAFDMRWYLRAELEHLLARAGFDVEVIHGDFDRSPLADASPEMIVCAVRR